MTLRFKLQIFAVALVVVPGALIGWLASASSRAALEGAIGLQLAREAGHTAEQISGALNGERQTLESFARQDLMREIRVGDIDKRIASALTTLRAGSPLRLDYLVHAEGSVIAATSAPLMGELPTALQDALAVDATGVPVIGPLKLPNFEAAVLLISAEVRNPDGGEDPMGTLVALLDWNRLTSAAELVRHDLAELGLETEVLIVGKEGEVLGGAAAGPLPAAVHWRAGTLPLRPTHGVDHEAGVLIGRASLAATLPELDLLITEPLDDAYAPVRRLTLRLLLLLGVAVSASVLLATLGAGRVARPLTALTRATQELASGESPTPTIGVRSRDEVGLLAESFNQMASRLDRAQRDLVEAAKFAFVGELAAGVAHEVRTSLGVLRSSAQILERSLPANMDPESIELAQLVRAEVDRLGRVVNDLLSLARPRELQLESVVLYVPIFRAVDLVEPQAQDQGIEILREAPHAELVARCDSELIYEVALNLLVNAVQAVPGAGRIEVRILDLGGEQVGFEVEDSGPGIPDDRQDQVFLPFVTGREGGVGLGLTFVKRVVHEHHGRITLRSSPQAGACFRVELPRAEAER